MKRTSRRQSVDRQIPDLLKKPITYELHDLLSLASGDDDRAADAARRLLNQFAARIAALFDYYGIDRTSDEPELRLFWAMGSDLFPNAFRIQRAGDPEQKRRPCERTIVDQMNLYVLMDALLENGYSYEKAAVYINEFFPDIAKGNAPSSIKARFSEARKTKRRVVDRGDVTPFEWFDLHTREHRRSE
jgi:hypothetical protein